MLLLKLKVYQLQKNNLVGFFKKGDPFGVPFFLDKVVELVLAKNRTMKWVNP